MTEEDGGFGSEPRLRDIDVVHHGGNNRPPSRLAGGTGLRGELRGSALVAVVAERSIERVVEQRGPGWWPLDRRHAELVARQGKPDLP